MKTDKKQHFIAGLLVAAFVGLPCYLESSNLFAGIWAALTAGVIAGGVKEWCDNTYDGEWSWKDFGFTCLGVAISAVVIVLMHFAKG